MDNKSEKFTFNPEEALKDFQAYLYEGDNLKVCNRYSYLL